MSISFKRNRAQLRCESILNCSHLEQWHISDFRNLRLNASQASLLSSDLLEDSKDLYYKGILSFFEAIKSISEGSFSWATVKVYYSVYYFLRCTLAANGVAIIRQKSLFYLKAIEGEQPVTKGNKKYNSDHSGTINYYIDLFTSDILLSQTIDSVNSFEWIMSRREQINYRERSFNEPEHSDFWDYIASQIKNGKLDKLIKDYHNDQFVLCFQEENAMLALPFKSALLTRDRLFNEGIDISLSISQINFLKTLLPKINNELAKLMDSTTAANEMYVP
jgi:hypothetical protein